MFAQNRTVTENDEPEGVEENKVLFSFVCQSLLIFGWKILTFENFLETATRHGSTVFKSLISGTPKTPISACSILNNSF